MSLFKIKRIIAELGSTGSSNNKKDILAKYKDDADWIKFLTYTHDEVKYTYGKSKLPNIPMVPTIKLENECISDQGLMELLYEVLDLMIARDLTGKAADEALCDILVGQPAELEEVAGLILKRDTKTKVGATMINEVYGDIITIPPYMRCEKENKLQARIKYPCYAQTKEDGLFLNIELFPAVGQPGNGGSMSSMNNNIPVPYTDVRVTTRQGFEVDPIPYLFHYIAKMFALQDQGVVLHGEALILNVDGGYMPRSQGNGLINSYVQQKTTRKTKLKEIEDAKTQKAKAKLEQELKDFEAKWKYCADNIVYVIWDVVERSAWKKLSYNVPYSARIAMVDHFVNTFKATSAQAPSYYSTRLLKVDTIIANTPEELMEYYQSKLDQKLEGIVAKNFDLTWCHDINIDGIIKLKDFKECDLIITGWNYGKPNTQFEKGVGSYTCESSEGLLIVDVSGLSLNQRGYRRVDPNDSSKGIELIPGFNADDNVGKIAAIKFNEVANNKTGKVKSLNFPSIIEIRESCDKSLAETLAQIEAK